MRALRLTGRDGPKSLVLSEVPEPSFGPSEVRIAVHAFGLNRADLLQTLGLYPSPPGVPDDIPGLEYAGTIEAVGDRVTRLQRGQEVMGIVGGGAFAERVVAHEREPVPVPQHLALVDAAAVPEVFFTAFDALVLQAQLRAGETLLVHAAGSGVGTAAVQLGAALGATVLGTSRSADKLARARPLGLTHALHCEQDPPTFAGAVLEHTGRRGADVVLDLVGGPYVGESLRAMASRGRLMLVGLVGGASTAIDLGLLMHRRATLTGTTLRGRPLEEKAAVAQAFERMALPLFASGKLRPIIDATLPVTEIGSAFDRMASNQTFGKLVLRWT